MNWRRRCHFFMLLCILMCADARSLAPCYMKLNCFFFSHSLSLFLRWFAIYDEVNNSTATEARRIRNIRNR